MIDRFLGDAFWVMSCPFWNTVLQCGVRLQIHMHLEVVDRAVSGAHFFYWGCVEWDIAHRRYMAVLCLLCKIRCNPMRPLN